MFSKYSYLFRKIWIKNYKNFSQHSKVIIVGAGTGGISTANQLIQGKNFKDTDITIFDPNTVHYYQPGFTKIAGLPKMEQRLSKYIVYDIHDITKNFNFINLAVKEFNPDNNLLIDAKGDKWTYDNLIVAAGLKINLESIPGLHDLLKKEDNFVGTIYDFNYSKKVARMRENFKGGKAIFTQPPPPIKCGGGPQKIVYLCNDFWKKNNINANLSFYTSASSIFGVKYFADALQNYANQNGINVFPNSQLIAVNDKFVTFKDVTTGETFQESYDFLHVVPHMQAPDFLIGSKISNPAGFVEVGRDLQHKKYKNIWALGDCVSLPNAKTAASVFSQTPVLVHNLNCHVTNDNHRVIYDGYASCPLYLEKGKLMLAEFREYPDENGNLQREVDESFDKNGQTKPRKLFYYMGLGFTFMYKLGIMGVWYGKHSIFKPNYFKEFKDPRWIYKYFLILPYPAILTSLGFIGLYVIAY